eukprot:scaffold266_cov391-Prasinococcus_capsulatus_cf.AAC.11
MVAKAQLPVEVAAPGVHAPVCAKPNHVAVAHCHLHHRHLHVDPLRKPHVYRSPASVTAAVANWPQATLTILTLRSQVLRWGMLTPLSSASPVPSCPKAFHPKLYTEPDA